MKTKEKPTDYERINRNSFGFAAILTGMALLLHISNWVRTGIVQWGLALNMAGVFILMINGAIDPSRHSLSVLGVGLILAGAYILILA